MDKSSKPKARNRPPSLNLTPLFLRDVEDLAALAKNNVGKHAENLFARAAVIFAAIALDHFIDLYLERISAGVSKEQAKKQIKELRRSRKFGSLLAAKWFVVSDHYTPNRFLPDVAPFSELKKLVKRRNDLVHIYEKQLRSRRKTGEPLLLREMTWKTAEEACRTAKNMVRAFYQMAPSLHLPGWRLPVIVDGQLSSRILSSCLKLLSEVSLKPMIFFSQIFCLRLKSCMAVNWRRQSTNVENKAGFCEKIARNIKSLHYIRQIER